ncbi:Putative aspartic peptidase A1 family, aspartic peptidase domain superfamily [Septoria linicola]|uniref:Aspartic peptidase A1 family, aspartic peptidase domain superfamily n=1 Tax=Septoria linicola TaxID=215465 RepID=A0A9Q9AD26_9PEZI|nr:putative aspartic peptidase A1 family, aspartic peptidase domain superfamily [Septoria linicola]USW46895.1 Putative aspartic peptidase A1 family, aspartic peptidase domain superfamily [Septoria linicola]
MKTDAPMRSANLAFATLLATPLAAAFSIPSILERSTAGAERIEKRADGRTTVPAPLSIAAAQNWDGNDGPWSSFPLQIGTQPQTVRAMIGTSATSVFTIAADGCPSYYPSNCETSRGGFFDVGDSSTWVPNSIYNVGIEQNLGLDTTGTTGFDKVVIGWPGAVQATADHNVVFNLDSPNFWLGIFGLNPRPTNFTTDASITEFNNGQTTFIQSLVNNRSIPSLSWAYTAGNQYRLDGNNLGSLTLGGYDESRYSATENLTLPFGSDQSRDLLVNLRAITTDAGSPSNLLPDGNIQIFLDSSVAQLWLPESACDAFEEAFGLTYDENFNFYLVNDTLHESLVSTNANVTFTLASAASGGETMDIVFPYGAFDLTLEFPNIMNPNTSNYFPLKRANSSAQYTLGRTFFQEAYVIADYDRSNFTVAPCEWDASRMASQNIKSILRANETGSDGGDSGSSNTGAIAGGVVGGVVGIIAIAGLVLFLIRRKKKTERQRLAELDNTSNGAAAGGAATTSSPHGDREAKTSSSSGESRPIISAPIGGELGGSEIHELTAPHKIHPQEMDSPYRVDDPNKHGYFEMESTNTEFFAPSKGVPAEMRGETPIYEMAGSDVSEMPAPRVNLSDRKK